MLVRSAIKRSGFFVISPIEITLQAYLQGNPLSNESVSSFVVNQRPQIKSINDFVFIHRLADKYCFDGPAQKPRYDGVIDYLKSGDLDISSESTTHLSVLISVLADSKVALNDLLHRCITEILDRDEETREIARICKGLARLANEEYPYDGILLCQLTEELRKTKPILDIEHLISCLELASADIRFDLSDFYGEISLMGPLMTPSQAAQSLVYLCSIDAVSENYFKAVSAIVANILSCGKLSRGDTVKAVASLGRIGAMSKRCRGLLTKTRLDTLSDEAISIVTAAITTSPTTGDDEEKLDTSQLKIFKSDLKNILDRIDSAKFTTIVRAVYGSVMLGEIVSEEKIARLFKKVGDIDLPEETRVQLCELALLFPGVERGEMVSSLIRSQIDSEKRSFEDSRIGQEVMKFFEADTISSLGETGLPAIRIGEKFIDVENLRNPCTRKIRSKIAENLGLKYKVVDSLSWFSGTPEERKEWLESDDVFMNNSAVHTGKNMEVPKIENVPHFQYVRKIDLR